MVNIKSELWQMWRESSPLTFVFLLMAVVFFANVLGMFLDGRVITGASAWLKPAKFSSSVAIYTGTLAWMLRYLSTGKQAGRVAGGIISVCGFLEVVVIRVQAGGGPTSHFNVR